MSTHPHVQTVPARLPEGDGVRVGPLPLPDEEGSISGDPHQHVLRFPPAQTVIVPPASRRGKQAGEDPPRLRAGRRQTNRQGDLGLTMETATEILLGLP